MTAIRVLLTNGESLSSLAFVRAIKDMNDVDLHVGCPSRFSACYVSRYCRNKFILRPSDKDSGQYLDTLLSYIKDNDIDVLIPNHMEDLDLIMENRQMFEGHVDVPFERKEKIDLVNDKLSFFRLAREYGIRTPETYSPETEEDLAELSEKISFPVVIKLRKGWASVGMRHVENGEDLKREYPAVARRFNLSGDNLPIIQEYVAGRCYGAAALCVKGDVKAVFAYKSIRENNPLFGTSIERTSVFDDRIRVAVSRILSELEWHGIAHFDFIERDGEIYVLEMNPRLWRSVNLPVKSGLNFPYYLCKMGSGSISPNLTYKSDITCIIFVMHSKYFIKSFYSDKFRMSAREYFSFLRSNCFLDEIELGDPLPLLPLLYKTIIAPSMRKRLKSR